MMQIPCASRKQTKSGKLKHKIGFCIATQAFKLATMRIAFPVSFLLLLLAGCTPKVVKYLNSQAKYDTFESYTLVNVKIDKRNLSASSTQLLGFIESHIKSQMEKGRGYVSSNVSPDLILRYELISNAQSKKINNNTNNNDINNILNRSIFNSNQNANTRVISESVILLELLNKRKLIWQGSYDLNQSRRTTKNEDIIRNAINRIFTTYPYRAGQSEPDPSLTEMKK